MTSPIIKIHNLRKIYTQDQKKIEALKGVSLEVASGEVFGFVGANGAGKSTTIKILLGLLPQFEGSIQLNGLSVDNPKARKGVGYVAETPRMPLMLSARELLNATLQLHGLHSKKIPEVSNAWLNKLGLSKLANRKIGALSKGNMQRVSIALAMSISPKLLVLDEPLSGLDPIGRKDVVDLLSDYKQQGGSIFFTSHVLHDVERIADRFGLIHQGEIRTIQSPNELFSKEQSFIVRCIGKNLPVGFTTEGESRGTIEVSNSLLHKTIELVYAHNCSIQEVKPSMSLERAFINFIRDEEPLNRSLN